MMSPDKSLQSLFNEALEREDPVERARFLDEACSTDAALRAQVEKLLRATADAGGFLKNGIHIPEGGCEQDHHRRQAAGRISGTVADRAAEGYTRCPVGPDGRAARGRATA